MGNSYLDDGLVRQSTYWFTLWVVHTSTNNFTQDASLSHSIWMTTFLVFIPISSKYSSNGTPTMVIKDTDLYASQDPCMLPVLSWLVGPPINLTGGIFTTGTGLSAFIWSFVNRTTGWWSAPSFTIAYFSANETSVDAFSMSLSLQYSVALLYRDSMSHSHIILVCRCQITNFY